MKPAGGPDLSLPEAEHRRQIAQLVQGDRVGEARRYLAALPADRYPGLDRWRTVLAAPVVSVLEEDGTDASDMAPNARWLEEHAAAHTGRWVALREGRLIDSDASLRVLRVRLSEHHAELEVDLICVPTA